MASLKFITKMFQTGMIVLYMTDFFFSVFYPIKRKYRPVWKLFAVSFGFVPLLFNKIGPSRIHLELVCGTHSILWHRFIRLQQ